MRRVIIGQMVWAMAAASPALAQGVISSETLAPPAGLSSKLPTTLSPTASAPALPKMPSVPSTSSIPSLPGNAGVPAVPTAPKLPTMANAPAMPSTTTAALKNLQAPPSTPNAEDVGKNLTAAPAATSLPGTPGLHGAAPSLLGHSAPGQNTPPGNAAAAAQSAPMRTAALAQPAASHTPHLVKPTTKIATAGKPVAHTPLVHTKAAKLQKASHKSKIKLPIKPADTTA